MSSARDEAILEFALRQNAVVVTLDADFHALLAVFGAHRPSVVRIRMQGLGALAVVHVVERTLGQFADDIENGALVTVKANKTSCRKLPIGGAGT
jgi:predicted nuclease of predicted toxin-antitoxin system